MSGDTGAVLVPGPWEHRFVPANGTRLHVAQSGTGPLVLLVHGYPQFWWSWRAQLPALADAGFTAAAVDLRGHGASDKPPRGYDPGTLCADLAALVRSLGHTRAVVIGHGLGGWLAWAMPHLHPQVVSAVGVLAMPHPRLLGPRTLPWRLARPMWQRPVRRVIGGPASRRLADPAILEESLHRWSAPGGAWPSTEVVARYSQALALPFTSRSATEAHRWLAGAHLHPAGRRLLRTIGRTVDVPVLQVHGAQDPLLPAVLAARSSGYVRGTYEWHRLPGVGHFVQEEAPAAATAILTRWLGGDPDDQVSADQPSR